MDAHDKSTRGLPVHRICANKFRQAGRQLLGGHANVVSAAVVTLWFLGSAGSGTAGAQDLSYSLSGDAAGGIVSPASHAGLLTCHENCPECRAYRQRYRSYQRGTTVCPPGSQPYFGPRVQAGEPGAAGEAGEPGEAGESLTAPDMEPSSEVSDLGQLAGSFGASGDVLSAAPAMIGDSFGGAVIISFPQGDEVFLDPVTTVVPNGGAARLVKISQHNSPLPRCRVFFDYSHFHNATQGSDGSGGVRDFNADRYVFGWEKCMLDNLMSIELRVPFSRMLSSDQIGFAGGVADTEFGNLTLAWKVLLWGTGSTAISAGLGVNFPTADDFRLSDPVTGRPVLELKDESVHLMPFVGWAWTPGGRVFAQSFIQLDFDSGGNDFLEYGERVGTYNDQSLMFVDGLLGYWLYRNRCAPYITGIAGLLELHYTTAIQDTDAVFTGAGRLIANPFNRIDVLNLTAGLAMNITEVTSLRVAAAAPLRNKRERFGDLDFSSRFFDAEVLVQLERRY